MEKKYDIAITYATEQQERVKELVDCFIGQNLNVFVDYRETHSLLSRYLPETLRSIYLNETKLIVIFLSKEYLIKDYTKFESRVASERNLKEDGSVIIIKYDEVELPWENSTMYSLRWVEQTAAQISEMLALKLSSSENITCKHLFSSIVDKAWQAMEDLNSILGYELVYQTHTDSFLISLSEGKMNRIIFSLSESICGESKHFSLYLDKNCDQLQSQLFNGSFTVRNDSTIEFINFGFFRGIFELKMHFNNPKQFIERITNEILKSGESLYD